jgi:hypothetical protein
MAAQDHGKAAHGGEPRHETTAIALVRKGSDEAAL